ncbi:MAG: hypothetical protein QM731_17155 [Chitinophagaceae bacterium]
MTIENFEASFTQGKPPAGSSIYLQSLWYDHHGNWEQAHILIQDLEADVIAAWIHAYLHRKEGDIWNADYWYRRANRTRPSFSLQDEWKQLVDYCITHT